jgi:hypothetical protein
LPRLGPSKNRFLPLAWVLSGKETG